MKYIRTKDGKIFEIVDYEQLDENTKKNVRHLRYVGLEDYLNEKIFVKIYKNMPNPISQYQSIKMFDILKQANTIEELCDEFVFEDSDGPYLCNFCEQTDVDVGSKFDELVYWFNHSKEEQYKKRNCYGAIWTDKGLIYVAKMNDKGELELLWKKTLRGIY